jgi:L-cysteine:1D-myo-inositol 2-amino-2-deoxy-alpha-D-glucopyranoside ligase
MPAATARLQRWRDAFARPAGAAAGPVVEEVRRALADDLQTPSALRSIDEWAATSGDDASSPALVAAAVDALLGIV